MLYSPVFLYSCKKILHCTNICMLSGWQVCCNLLYRTLIMISAAFKHSVLCVWGNRKMWCFILQYMGHTNHKFPVYTTRNVQMPVISNSVSHVHGKFMVCFCHRLQYKTIELYQTYISCHANWNGIRNLKFS